MSAAAAAGAFVLGSLDRDGNFRARFEWPLPLLLLPYLLLAIAGLWSRSRIGLALACLITAVVVAAVGLGTHWQEYQRWRATPPNQQAQSWGLFLALIAQLAACAALYVGIGSVRLARARQLKSKT